MAKGMYIEDIYRYDTKEPVVPGPKLRIYDSSGRPLTRAIGFIKVDKNG